MKASRGTEPATGTVLAHGRAVVEREAEALRLLSERLDSSFVETVRVLERTLERGGRILLTGMGKSGLAARKIACRASSESCVTWRLGRAGPG